MSCPTLPLPPQPQPLPPCPCRLEDVPEREQLHRGPDPKLTDLPACAAWVWDHLMGERRRGGRVSELLEDGVQEVRGGTSRGARGVCVSVYVGGCCCMWVSGGGAQEVRRTGGWVWGVREGAEGGRGASGVDELLSSWVLRPAG